jgi:glyoxylase-like metal-dependent hydrolase (beta-lactamase superfamily II)
MKPRRNAGLNQMIQAFSLIALLMLAVTTNSAPDNGSKIGFSVIKTSASAGTPEALVVTSGSWFTSRHLSQNAVLIKHPKGDVLIDTGLGRNIELQFAENSFVNRQLFSFEGLDPAADQLERNQYTLSDISKIIPTHLHWDHASGIEDFPESEVWVQKAEYEQAINGKPPVHIPSQFDDSNIKWKFVKLAKQSFEGFASSYDVYDDESIVLVDISGHSAGQIGIFLTVSSGKRYFFIGDTTWTLKGIEDNAQRSDMIKWLVEVNWNTEKNTEQIGRIHEMSKNKTKVQIVPAHDEFVMSRLPAYPKITY